MQWKQLVARILVVAPGLQVLVACGASVKAEQTDVESGPANAAEGGPADATEGGSNPEGSIPCTCSAGFYCTYNYEPGSCGRDGIPGDCTPVPSGCSAHPVCGCDGVVYGSSCESAARGVALSWDEDCAPPEGTFACGSQFCRKGTEICFVNLSDVIGAPAGYICRVAPPACIEGARSCACVGTIGQHDTCEQTAGGDLRITCPWYDTFPVSEGGTPICSGHP
jgi:hypothetical protein